MAFAEIKFHLVWMMTYAGRNLCLQLTLHTSKNSPRTLDESQKITKLSSRNVEIFHACYRLNSNIIIIGQPHHPVVGRRPQHAGSMLACLVPDRVPPVFNNNGKISTFDQ